MLDKIIHLTKGKITVVDADEYDKLNSVKWQFQATNKYPDIGYATRGNTQLTKYSMHRVITNAPKGMHVDHENGDRLDNRRQNLRVCTPGENIINMQLLPRNTSGFKGVTTGYTRVDGTKSWRAALGIDNKRVALGSFLTAEDAARAYDAAAIEEFGEFARTNVMLGLLLPLDE